MIRFLIAYLVIYGSVHAVVFQRLRGSFHLNRWATLGVLCFIFLMLLSPLVSRLLETRQQDAAARVVAYVGYYWMGFLFYAFLGCVCLYIVDLLSWGCSFLNITLPMISKKAQFIGLTGLVVLLMAYGHFEAWHIKTEKFKIHTHKLPAHVSSLRIVQITDVHLGIITREKFLNRLTEKILSLSPDVLVCTGDLVDGSMVNLMHLAKVIQKINPTYGKFAITGNHEYYAGLDHAIDFMEASGFTILRQQVKTINEVINIAGIDDGGRNAKPDAVSTLSAIDNGLLTLYLVHRPDMSKRIMGLYDLQLCGHTHGGQMFPFNYLVSLAFPLIKGLHTLENGSILYVSRGTGTWGPPIRILAPPEISVFEITRK